MNIKRPIDNYDWEKAFQYCGEAEDESAGTGGVYGSPSITVAAGSSAKPKGFQRKDVTRVVTWRDGENDGPPWLGIFALADGRYAFVDAGCDYTGWDCQASGRAVVSHDLEHLIQYGLTDEFREELGL